MRPPPTATNSSPKSRPPRPSRRKEPPKLSRPASPPIASETLHRPAAPWDLASSRRVRHLARGSCGPNQARSGPNWRHSYRAPNFVQRRREARTDISVLALAVARSTTIRFQPRRRIGAQRIRTEIPPPTIRVFMTGPSGGSTKPPTRRTSSSGERFPGTRMTRLRPTRRGTACGAPSTESRRPRDRTLRCPVQCCRKGTEASPP
jgi:hypothetical protein